MKWTNFSKTTALLSGLFLITAACGGEEEDPTQNQVQVDPPTIASFQADFNSITSGTNYAGANVQGNVTLSWQAEGVAQVELYANGQAVALDSCDEADEGDAHCNAEGSVTLTPSESTTYRLDVLSIADGACEFDGDEIENGDVCASTSLDVEVIAPAVLTFDHADGRFEADTEFTVSYAVSGATDWQIGLLDGGHLEPCEVDSASAQCSLPGSDDVADSDGELTIRDTDTTITLSGTATNGAGDGLGDIAAGDVSLELIPLGTPVINAFSASPTHVVFGGSTELSWDVEDSDEVVVTSNADIYIDSSLAECASVDPNGQGFCDVFFSQSAPEITITFTLVAHGEDNQVSSPREVTVILGAPPVISEFTADPAILPASGGDVVLSWTTTGEPQNLVITDDADPANIILDTSDDVGVENCQSMAEGCDTAADSFLVSDVEVNTRFTLIATSPLGADSSSVNITISGSPQITSITVEGQDALAGPVIVDADNASFSWDTEDTNDSELERAPRPADGCDSPDTDWTEVTAFAGGADGSYQLDNLDVTRQCFRLTALGDADQQARETFQIVRHPMITDFSSDRGTLQTGDDVELSWTAPFATSVSVSVSPSGSVTSNDLAECTSAAADVGTGSCTVTIQPGSPQGDVTFTLVASGFDDTETDPEQLIISVGTAPTINSFSSDPSTATDAVQDIVLSWSSNDGTALSITDGQDEIFSTTVLSEVSSGSHTAEDLDETTTFTVTVSNQFGQVSSQTTTFFGPSVDLFEINGHDALAGSVAVLTGDVSFAWETTNADDSVLERADVIDHETEECDDNWEELTSLSTGDGSFDELDVIENGCYRLTLSNQAGQTSSLTRFVRDVPHLASIATDRTSINGNTSSDVIISMSLTGATTLSLTAHFYDENDESIGSPSNVCNHNNLSGSLTGSAEVDEVSCEHQMNGEVTTCGLLTCTTTYDPPQDTAYIVYRVTFGDPEGDSDEAETNEDEDVDVTW